MGHERTGSLPKSQPWRSIVSQLSTEETDARSLADDTLSLVGRQLRALERDQSLAEAFKFLIRLSLSARGTLQDPTLPEFSPNTSPLQLASALRNHLADVGESQEYRAIAIQAATDAIARWYREHRTGHESLFDEEGLQAAWREAGQGRGFCELARGFFSSVVERYLLYFLEREAGRSVASVDDRLALTHSVRERVDDVSKHAFETARITQSYAAGWFNKFAATGMPSEAEVGGFLEYSLKKLRDELRVESGRP